MTITNMHNILRTLGIENSRVLNIHFPDHQTAALLIHNEYATNLYNRLRKLGVTPKKSYDPCDPINLRNPKFAALTTEERQVEMTSIHYSHVIKALDFIKAPIQHSVAHSFFTSSLITEAEYAKYRPPYKSNTNQQGANASPTGDAEAAAIAALQSLGASGSGNSTNDDDEAMADAGSFSETRQSTSSTATPKI